MLDKLKTGTTTVGIVCKDGVIVAADKKATMGYLVASKKFKKIFQITDNMAITTAGSVGDAQALVRLLKAEMRLYELQEKTLTVKAASTLLANVLRSSYKSFIPELVQLTLAGYDDRGPQLYTLDPGGGVSDEDEYSFTGSGSVIAVGVLEDLFKKGMSIEEGKQVLIRALKAAKERDINTGGIGMDIAVITKKGIEFSSTEKIEKPKK